MVRSARQKKNIVSSSSTHSAEDWSLSIIKDDLLNLFKWTIVHRIIAITILIISNKFVQPFDSSGLLLLKLDSASASTSQSYVNTIAREYAFSSLRWDILHFLGVASPRPLPLSDLIDTSSPLNDQIWSPIQGAGGGLQYEHSIAFQPGIIWLLRLTGYSVFRKPIENNNIQWNPIQSIWITGFLASTISVCLPLLFYILTISLTNNKAKAKLSSFLSIFSFAPATLITPTPEPFFAFFALIGHTLLALSRKSNQGSIVRTIIHTLLASISYAFACCFRANGILLVGFLIWHMIWNERCSNILSFFWRIVWSIILSCITISPFVLSQIWSFNRLCLGSSIQDWCISKFVLPYNYVQSYYWNVGPFRYWTISQIPNWILASPVLYLLGRWVMEYYKPDPKAVVNRTLEPLYVLIGRKSDKVAERRESNGITLDIHSAPSLFPFAHYTLALLLILLISSHVQIALRFATQGAVPAVWWSLATIVQENRFPLRSILAFILSWQVISIVLYAGFYPPA